MVKEIVVDSEATTHNYENSLANDKHIWIQISSYTRLVSFCAFTNEMKFYFVCKIYGQVKWSNNLNTTFPHIQIYKLNICC